MQKICSIFTSLILLMMYCNSAQAEQSEPKNELIEQQQNSFVTIEANYEPENTESKNIKANPGYRAQTTAEQRASFDVAFLQWLSKQSKRDENLRIKCLNFSRDYWQSVLSEQALKESNEAWHQTACLNAMLVWKTNQLRILEKIKSNSKMIETLQNKADRQPPKGVVVGDLQAEILKQESEQANNNKANWLRVTGMQPEKQQIERKEFSEEILNSYQSLLKVFEVPEQ
ncbi:MAG: hypothetical protein IPP97_27120 [Candidatus Obscuribacter sp.]|nr:hypothetical protein [Candidatus Obscuribacter sp.]MBP6595692.1 hypothetical protein [Candidatus Obscuribacter sp.]MBP7577129.1 hypothetical protein [Candidatus Obscuribacter sp.]